jgi:hypothetical protein
MSLFQDVFVSQGRTVPEWRNCERMIPMANSGLRRRSCHCRSVIEIRFLRDVQLSPSWARPGAQPMSYLFEL